VDAASSALRGALPYQEIGGGAAMTRLRTFFVVKL